MPINPVISIEDLSISIDLAAEAVMPVHGVSLAIEQGQTLGLVGESGCGKSLTCLAVLGLLRNPVRMTDGRIVLHGRDLMDPAERAFRHQQIGMIFQNPLSCLNPVRTIGWQVAEAYRLRTGASMRVAKREAVGLLARVGIPEAARRARDYPHQLSGGMNQRAMIAMAIAGSPALLIADEATTALDVTVQAQILALLKELQSEFGMAMLFVTHNLGLVAEIAGRVAVMYAGRVVEEGPAERVFASPRHPYTAGLLACLPLVDEDIDRLQPIDGIVPPLTAMPGGCAFTPRCSYARGACGIRPPPLENGVACYRPLMEQAA